MIESEFPEKNVTLLMTDMVGFGQKTVGMKPREVADFLIEYRKNLDSLILRSADGAQYFEHTAGDATASIFETRGSEGDAERNFRAFRVALRILEEMGTERILPTRMGLYSGRVIEAPYNNQLLRFGGSFTAASRLESLCGYFGTSLLMDRDVAHAQPEQAYIACIGKITPKGLSHPIHMFTIYGPGFNGCPKKVELRKLQEYVRTKNEAVEHFCGNFRRGVRPDFPSAREKLYRAANLFRAVTGNDDIATGRIIEYISQHNLPDQEFVTAGMKLQSKSGNTPLGLQLFRLSQELLKALDREFYDSLVLSREWEHCFKLEWRQKGEVIIESGAKPDGVYFLTKGKVRVLDAAGRKIAVIREGDVFGEMAYFSIDNSRSATVVADSDLVLYRISGEDFMRFPSIRNLFGRIAQKRAKGRQNPHLRNREELHVLDNGDKQEENELETGPLESMFDSLSATNYRKMK